MGKFRERPVVAKRADAEVGDGAKHIRSQKVYNHVLWSFQCCISGVAAVNGFISFCDRGD